MAFVSKEEKQKYYDKFPPGTKVFIKERQDWLRGTVIERYLQSGTVKIRCESESGTELTILYGDRGAILLAQGDPSE